jgi:hypothetical protein
LGLKSLPFLVSLVLAIPHAGRAQSGSDEWEFALTPYLWLAGIDGTIGLSAREADFEVTTKELLKSLDFGLMGNFLARKNRLSFGGDLVYTNLGKDVALGSSGRAATVEMELTILEGNVGYGAVESLDVLFGIRGVLSDVSLESDSTALAEGDTSFADPFVGVRFQRDLSEKVWVNLRSDAGGFGVGSDFSWFLAAVAGVRVSRSISLDFGYRVYDMDYESANELRRLDATLAGFALGATFQF